MPFNLIDTDCSHLVIDYEYEITDNDLLAEYIGELVLGHYVHILNIINSLSSSTIIAGCVRKLDNARYYKYFDSSN